MSVVVEISTSLPGDLRALRVTMTRVPVVGEIIRILYTLNGATTELRFAVRGVTHVGHTEAYPSRPRGIDAWVSCEAMT